MPLYLYRCDNHGTFDTLARDDRQPCPQCQHPGRRIFTFTVGEAFIPHYNPEFGTYLTSRRQAVGMLNEMSDRKSAEQGTEVRFGMVDIGDHDARGTSREQLAEEKARTEEFKSKKVTA